MWRASRKIANSKKYLPLETLAKDCVMQVTNSALPAQLPSSRVEVPIYSVGGTYVQPADDYTDVEYLDDDSPTSVAAVAPTNNFSVMMMASINIYCHYCPILRRSNRLNDLKPKQTSLYQLHCIHQRWKCPNIMRK